MSNVVIYCTFSCPYCMRAFQLLDRKKVTYKVVSIDGDVAVRREMESKSQRTSVPQIFIDDFHVGGYDDMVELDMDGELDTLLGLDS